MEPTKQQTGDSTPNNMGAEAVTTPQSAGQKQTTQRLLTDKSFPSAVDFLVFFGIFLLSQGVGAFVGWALFGWPDKTLIQQGDAATQMVAQYAEGHFNAVCYFVAMSLTLLGFLFYRYRRRGPKIIARFSLRGFNPALLLWGIIFMFAASVVAEPLLAMMPKVPDVYGRGGWMLITLVVMAPIFEEVIFRGVLLESSRAKYGVTAAWLLSSLAFGLVHMHPTLVVNSLIIGLILGFIYIRSSSLWAPIILHAANNALAYLLLVSGHANVMLSNLIENRTIYIMVYIVAVSIFVISGYMALRTLKAITSEDKNCQQA